MLKITGPSSVLLSLSDSLFVSREEVDPPVENGCNARHQHRHQQVVQAASLRLLESRGLSPQIEKIRRRTKKLFSVIPSPCIARRRCPCCCSGHGGGGRGGRGGGG